MGLFSNFFGDDSRDDINAGVAQANKHLSGGLSGFENALNPAIEGTDLAQQQYLASLGLLGEGAEADFARSMQNSPIFQASLDQSAQGIARGAAARGNLGGGGTLKALGEHLSGRFLNEQVGRRQNQLGGLTTQGFGLRNELGNARFGTGQLRANLATGQGNALAETRSTGLNNLIGMGTAIASAF